VTTGGGFLFDTLVYLRRMKSKFREAFQKFVEPWMAEHKRHMDVPAGALFGKPLGTCSCTEVSG